nr:MAG TPA: portal protein [Caudoviricetes sp.]
MPYTIKQKEYIANAVHRWNIKSGAVRSGKSFVDVTYIVPMRIRERIGKDGLCFIIGVSKETIERNVLQPMRERYSSNIVGTINSRNIAKICGEDVYCLGAEKVSQVAKIQGASAKYIYGDEVAKWNEDVFNMLKSRLDKPYSCFDGSLNPEHPTHWLKKFIDSDADMQFGRLDWEFESGERAIYIDPAALKDGKTDRLNKRLYRAVDVDMGDEELFKDFSPTLRQSDITDGLNTYLRMIEFAVGLAYGDLSNPETVAKTATEVKSAKDRKYNTVSAIQKQLRYCLDDLVYALAFYNSLTTSGYTFVCDFKDSILTDEETERKQDIQDLSLGILRPDEYRAKWYGEDIKTAEKNLPQKAEVMD